MRKQRSVFKVIRQYKKKLRKMVRYEKSILFAVRYKELAVTFKREFFHRPRFDIIQKLKELADLSAINHRSYIKRRRNLILFREIASLVENQPLFITT